MNTRSMQRQMDQLARAIKPIPMESGANMESTRMEATPMESTRIEEAEPFQVSFSIKFLYFFAKNFSLATNCAE